MSFWEKSEHFSLGSDDIMQPTSKTSKTRSGKRERERGRASEDPRSMYKN
jgi:hypothetical protein